jgi:hypothetical protein
VGKVVDVLSSTVLETYPHYVRLPVGKKNKKINKMKYYQIYLDKTRN